MEAGTIIDTPHGWGVVASDKDDVCISLDSGDECTLSEAEALKCPKSFAPLGACVQTKLGCGVLLDYRKHDGVHKVCLWQRRGSGNGTAWLATSMFVCTLAAIPGIPVLCHGSDSPINGVAGEVTQERVEVTHEGGSEYWAPSEISCPIAKVMPVVDLFMDTSREIINTNMGLLRKLRHVVESAGLLDPELHSKVQDAMTAVTGIVSGDDSLAMLVSDHLFVDFELKRLLREGVEHLKSYAHMCAVNPLAASILLRHWSFQPSTLANYLEVSSPLDALDQLENAWQSHWWEHPSTLCNRVELHKRDKICDVDGIINLVPVEFGANIKQMLVTMRQVAADDPAVKDVLEQIQCKLESLASVSTAIQESRVGSAIADGVSRMQAKKSEIVKSSTAEIGSQSDSKLAIRGRKFVERLKQEQNEIQTKVVDIAVAGIDKYGSLSVEQIEEWLARVREVVEDSLEKCRIQLFANFQCFGVEDKVMELMSLDLESFSRAVEDVLAQSSVAMNLSGTHIRNLYNKNKTDFSKYSSRSLLNALEGSGIYIPQPIMEAIVAASEGDDRRLGTALVDTLDADQSVDTVKMVMEKGEYALDELMTYANQSAQGSATEAIMHAVVDKFDSDHMEDALFASIKQLNAKEILGQAEDAFNQVDALSVMANNIKDSVLQFVLEILPAIRIPTISDVYDAGFAGNIAYSLDNLDLSGFRFRTEDVELVFPEDLDKTFVIELVAKNVSATFTNLKISFEQQNFPYMQGKPIASADAQGISLNLKFTVGSNGAFDLTNRSIEIESLSLQVEAIGVAFLVNVLSSLFSSVIKDYVKTSLEEKIGENVDPLLTTLNNYVDELPLALRSKLRACPPSPESVLSTSTPLESSRSTRPESVQNVGFLPEESEESGYTCA